MRTRREECRENGGNGGTLVSLSRRSYPPLVVSLHLLPFAGRRSPATRGESEVRDEMWGGVWVGRADDVSGVRPVSLRSLLTLGSLPSPHVSDGNGTEGGVDGTEVRWR